MRVHSTIVWISFGISLITSCDEEGVVSYRNADVERSKLFSSEVMSSEASPENLKFELIDFSEVSRPNGEYFSLSGLGFIYRNGREVFAYAEGGSMLVGGMPKVSLPVAQIAFEIPAVGTIDQKVGSWIFVDENESADPQKFAPGFQSHDQVLQRPSVALTDWKRPALDQARVLYAGPELLWLQSGSELWHLRRHLRRIEVMDAVQIEGDIIGLGEDYFATFSKESGNLVISKIVDDSWKAHIFNGEVLPFRPSVSLLINGFILIVSADGQIALHRLSVGSSWNHFAQIGLTTNHSSITSVFHYTDKVYLKTAAKRYYVLHIEQENVVEEIKVDETETKLTDLYDVLMTSCAGCHAVAEDQQRYENAVEFDFRILSHWRYFIEKEGLQAAEDIVLNDMCHRSIQSVCGSAGTSRGVVEQFLKDLGK